MCTAFSMERLGKHVSDWWIKMDFQQASARVLVGFSDSRVRLWSLVCKLTNIRVAQVVGNFFIS
jgi:hypothetical protein